MKITYEKSFLAIGIAYVFVGVLTFGYSYNRLENNKGDEVHVIGAMGCAFAWPLYWSVQLFKPPIKE